VLALAGVIGGEMLDAWPAAQAWHRGDVLAAGVVLGFALHRPVWRLAGHLDAWTARLSSRWLARS